MKVKIVREFTPHKGEGFYKIYANDEYYTCCYFKEGVEQYSYMHETKAIDEANRIKSQLEPINSLEELVITETIYETPINTELKSSADYELMLRILVKHRYDAEYLKEVLVKMRTGGISNGSWGGRLRANLEDRMAWKINNLKPYFFTLYLKPARKIFQFIHTDQLSRVKLKLTQLL